MPRPIFYLGPEGTHSHEAAQRRFGDKARLTPCLSHYDNLARLLATRATDRPLAIVPVENSIEGPVTQTLDQLASHQRLTILDSFSVPVRQHLLALPGATLKSIRRVVSHPQALGQCRNLQKKYLPKADFIPEASTAAAAQRAAREPGTAAIASETAARLHGLEILRPDVQDGDANTTRFFTLARTRPPRSTAKNDVRSLIYLVIGNRPGALLHVLSPFDAAGVNLTFIQSRPLAGRPWEYGFFIEAVTDWQSEPAKAAWKMICALAESGRILGTYPIT